MNDDEATGIYRAERDVTVFAVIRAGIRNFKPWAFKDFPSLFEIDRMCDQIRFGLPVIPFERIIHLVYILVYTFSKGLPIGFSRLLSLNSLKNCHT